MPVNLSIKNVPDHVAEEVRKRVARSDMNEIFDFIARDNPVAAARFVKEMERQIRSLA